MTLNDKIKQLIILRNLTPTRFADEIAVPRPSISHILSGRNKPSLEIVQKIIKTYPEIGFDWVLEDETEITQNTSQSLNNQGVRTLKRLTYPSRDLNTKNSSSTRPLDSNVESNVLAGLVGHSTKKVERIVIFYADQTFTEFKST